MRVIGVLKHALNMVIATAAKVSYACKQETSGRVTKNSNNADCRVSPQGSENTVLQILPSQVHHHVSKVVVHGWIELHKPTESYTKSRQHRHTFIGHFTSKLHQGQGHNRAESRDDNHHQPKGHSRLLLLFDTGLRHWSSYIVQHSCSLLGSRRSWGRVFLWLWFRHSLLHFLLLVVLLDVLRKQFPEVRAIFAATRAAFM